MGKVRSSSGFPLKSALRREANRWVLKDRRRRESGEKRGKKRVVEGRRKGKNDGWRKDGGRRREGWEVEDREERKNGGKEEGGEES